MITEHLVEKKSGRRVSVDFQGFSFASGEENRAKIDENYKVNRIRKVYIFPRQKKTSFNPKMNVVFGTSSKILSEGGEREGGICPPFILGLALGSIKGMA